MANEITFGTRLKLAGKSLAGLNFGDAATALVNPYLLPNIQTLLPEVYSRGSVGNYFGFNTVTTTWFNYVSHESCIQAYRKCAPLTAIINKKAQAHLTGRQTVVSTAGQRKDKEATNEQAMRLKALLKRPNKLQTWNEFEAQVKIYQQLFGYCLLLPIVPSGFPAIYATAVWVIPPSMCEITERQSMFVNVNSSSLIESIWLTYGGERVSLPVDSVFLIKDISPSFCSFMLPESRVRSLEQPINNIIGAYNSRGSLIDDRGALGMISSEKSDESGQVPLTPKEKLEVQEEFSKYGIKKGQFKYIITTAALKWTSIGFATKDLMLFEEIEDDVDRIHDAYGTNKRLFSNNRNNSLGGSDAAEFDKQFYQNTIIPESDTLYDLLNEMFETEKYSIRLVNDFSHLAVLQADALKTAQAESAASKALQVAFLCNIITVNEWREKQHWEALPAELGDRYYSDIKAMIGTPALATDNQDTQGNQAGNDTGKLIAGFENVLKQYFK